MREIQYMTTEKIAMLLLKQKATHLFLDATPLWIPNSVTSIGEYAFTELENLTLITIPENVTHIDDSAIHCPNLSVIFGKKGSCAETYANTQNIKFIGLCTIAEGTTGNCTWSIDAYGILTISGDISGDGVMEDYSYDNPAPWKDYELSAVIIDDYVTTIGDYAFSNCSNLRYVVISNSVNSIGIDSFSGCSNMTIHGKGKIARREGMRLQIISRLSRLQVQTSLIKQEIVFG